MYFQLMNCLLRKTDELKGHYALLSGQSISSKNHEMSFENARRTQKTSRPPLSTSNELQRQRIVLKVRAGNFKEVALSSKYIQSAQIPLQCLLSWFNELQRHRVVLKVPTGNFKEVAVRAEYCRAFLADYCRALYPAFEGL